MRLVSALIPTLLLAATPAVAAPTPSGQGVAGPETGQAQKPQGHFQQSSSGVAGAWAGSSRTQSASWPTYAQDKATDAACYTVFGELRCDRVPKKSRSK